MENESTTIKAVIKANTKKWYLFIWWAIIAFAILLGTGWHEDSHQFAFRKCTTYHFRVLFVELGYKDEYYDDYYNYGEMHNKGDVVYNFDQLPLTLTVLILILVALIVVIPLVQRKLTAYVANRCSLEMTERGIYGNRKTIFSNKELNLPIDKIDNVMKRNSLLDKVLGGKTVSVRSASGCVRFPWVQNADEFVSETLAIIEMYKKSVPAPAAAPVVQNIPQSNADELAKFKQLLDSGAITQEEYDAKKKQLLGL